MNKNNTVEKVIFNKIYEKKEESSFLKLRSLMNNPAFRQLECDGSLLGKIKLFIKRVIRKFTKFYIEPITFQQTDFNKETVKALESIQKALDEEKETNKNRIETLNKKIESLSRENEDLRQKLLDNGEKL